MIGNQMVVVWIAGVCVCAVVLLAAAIAGRGGNRRRLRRVEGDLVQRMREAGSLV